VNNILDDIAIIFNRAYPKKFKPKLEFAAAADHEETTIRRVLKGKQNLSIKLLQQICNSLAIKLSDLFNEIGY
jgi:DNA-binding XRE family transcriptional regulator